MRKEKKKMKLIWKTEIYAFMYLFSRVTKNTSKMQY